MLVAQSVFMLRIVWEGVDVGHVCAREQNLFMSSVEPSKTKLRALNILYGDVVKIADYACNINQGLGDGYL